MIPAMIPALGMLPMDAVSGAPLIAIGLGSLLRLVAWAAIVFGVTAAVARSRRQPAVPSIVIAPLPEAAPQRAA